MTNRIARGLGVLLCCCAGLGWPQEELRRSFEDYAQRVVKAFQAATDGVRNVKIDLRRRDSIPDADISMVGVLGFDMKPKDDPSWHSVRLLFGEKQGSWRYLQALHEIQTDHPAWTEGGAWYGRIVKQVDSK